MGAAYALVRADAPAVPLDAPVDPEKARAFRKALEVGDPRKLDVPG